MLSLPAWSAFAEAASLLAKGGPVMVPLLLCSLLALAVVLERAWTWARSGSWQEADRVLALAADGRWDEATEAGGASRSPVARVLAEGLRHRQAAPALAMEAAALAEAARLKRFLPLLDTIVTLSPLLGLLGTVTGMIGAFGIMAQAGMNEPHAITGGVAEALVATATGLAVAILALVPYNHFQGRVERLLETIERYASRHELLLAWAAPPAASADTAGVGRAQTGTRRADPDGPGHVAARMAAPTSPAGSPPARAGRPVAASGTVEG